jgi:hypothetical protein
MLLMSETTLAPARKNSSHTENPMPEEPPTTTCQKAHVLTYSMSKSLISTSTNAAGAPEDHARTDSVADFVALTRCAATHAAMLPESRARARRHGGKLAMAGLPIAPAASASQAYNNTVCIAGCEQNIP